MAVVYVSNTDPEWRVVVEQGHLVVERQLHHPTNVEAVLTRCGLITTPSARDRRLTPDQAPTCRVCQLLDER